MTSLLSGIHKYLTNKNTKKGQKLRKKLSLRERSHFLPLKTGTALSPQAKAVQHPAGSRFFEMISFFCTLYLQTSWLRKSEETQGNPRNLTISGGRSHDIFFGFTICIAPPKKIFPENSDSTGRGRAFRYPIDRFSDRHGRRPSKQRPLVSAVPPARPGRAPACPRDLQRDGKNTARNSRRD